jgi:hypothetical protein
MAALLPPSAPPRAFRHAVAHPPLAAAHARPVATLAPGGASSRPSPWRGAAPSALLALRSGRGSPDEADRSGADWVTSLAGLTAPIRRPGLGTLHTRGTPRVRRYGILEGDKATQPTDERVEPLAEQKVRGNDQPCNITPDHLRSWYSCRKARHRWHSHLSAAHSRKAAGRVDDWGSARRLPSAHARANWRRPHLCCRGHGSAGGLVNLLVDENISHRIVARLQTWARKPPSFERGMHGPLPLPDSRPPRENSSVAPCQLNRVGAFRGKSLPRVKARA